MIDIKFLENSIIINGKKLNFIYSIKTAFALGNKIIILFDPDSHKSKFGQFQNLIALDIEGCEIWKAELPTVELSIQVKENI